MNLANMSLTLTSNQGLLSGDYLSGDYLSLYRKRVAYGEDPDTIILYLTNLINNRKTSKEVRPTSSRTLVRLTPNQKLVRLTPEKMEAMMKMMEELHTSNEPPFVDKESTKIREKEVVIDYIEVEEFGDGNNLFLYGLPDAESYINHMKIKDVKEIIKIGVAYSDKSMMNDNFKQLLTESREDEKWSIKKTGRKNKTTHTQEEIKKQEDGIDFNTNCQACIYNGVKGSMRPCKKSGVIMRGTHRICKGHNKTADKHLAKYINWTEEMGTLLGWYGEEETYHQDIGRVIKEDWVKPSRK